jgi:drug/metabolite transporter (DMT)-like permease
VPLTSPTFDSRAWLLLALTAVYVIWGSTYLAMRVAVESIPPFLMAGARFLLVGLVLLALLRSRGAPWPSRREWYASAPVAALMFVLGNGTVAWAEQRVSSGVAALVCGTMPLWVVALGRLFGEKATAREWVGLLLGVGGVGVLGLGWELRAEPLSAAVVLVAPISWALGSILARRLPLAAGLMSAATQMVAGGAMLLTISMLAGESWPEHIPARAWWAWGYLAVFGSLVAYSAYTHLLRVARPAVATSYSYVNPPIAVLLGVLFAGERLGPETMVCVLLVIAACALVVTQGRTRARAAVGPDARLGPGAATQ